MTPIALASGNWTFDLTGHPVLDAFINIFIVCFILINFIAVYAGVSTYAERKIAGHMQARVGPYRIGPGSAVEPQAPTEETPIWLAALMANRVQASASGEPHAIRWNCVAGRALYTNHGPEAEVIDPLGVYLERGYTVSVTWEPGETEYTVEVFGGLEHCA